MTPVANIVNHRESSSAHSVECRSFRSAYVVSRRDVQNWNQTFMTEVRSYASFSRNSISSPARIIGKRKPEDYYLDIVFAKQSVCSFGKHAKFRELTIRRVKVEIGDAFRRERGSSIGAFKDYRIAISIMRKVWLTIVQMLRMMWMQTSWSNGNRIWEHNGRCRSREYQKRWEHS